MFVRTSYWETFLCFFVLYAYLCVCVTGKDRKGGMPRERLYRPIPENIVINTVTFTMTSVVMEKSVFQEVLMSAGNIPHPGCI